MGGMGSGEVGTSCMGTYIVHKTADRPTAVVQVLEGLVKSINVYITKNEHVFQRLKSSAHQKKKTQVLNVDLGGPTEW